MGRNGAAGHFDGENGSGTLDERADTGTEGVHVFDLAFVDFLHVTREWAKDSVTEENAEEGADKGGGDVFADFFGRAAEGTHGDDNTEYRRNDAQAGEGVRHLFEGGNRGLEFVFHDVDVGFHALFEFKVADATGYGSAQSVADKIECVVVGGEDFVLLEELALFGIVDVAFELLEAILAAVIEDIRQSLEGIEVSFLVVRATFEDADQVLDQGHDIGDGVGNEQTADGSAKDNDEFGRLPKYEKLAVSHCVAATDGGNHENDTDDREHCCRFLSAVGAGLRVKKCGDQIPMRLQQVKNHAEARFSEKLNWGEFHHRYSGSFRRGRHA